MIATCPACGKRYRIADDAVPAVGREVRCAACRHGWTVLPDGSAAAAVAPPLTPVPVPEALVAAPSPVAAALPDAPPSPLVPTADAAMTVPSPRAAAASPVAEPPALGPPMRDAPSPDASLDAAVRPRRRLGWLVALLAVFAVLAALAVVEFAPADTFAPPRLGLPAPVSLGLPVLADVPPLDLTRVPLIGDALDRLANPLPTPASPLRVTATGVRRTLANGTRVLTVTGAVANPTDAPVALSFIDAALIDPAGGAPFRWRIAAPATVIAAHGSAAFDAVAANFPAGATVLRTTPR